MGRKPIQINDDYRAALLRDFLETISKTNLFDGTIKYEKKLTLKGNQKVTILFTPEAFVKQTMLIQTQKEEVGWHGAVKRIDDYTFLIYDIMVYPQKVTGTTINPDQEEYQLWLTTMPDEEFNACRYHGHSHVDMGVFSSGTDAEFQNDILSQLTGDDDFYIFLVWNKRMQVHKKVFDIKNNVYYDDDDVLIGFDGGELDVAAWVEEAGKMVTKDVVKPVGTYKPGQNYYGNRIQGFQTPQNSKKDDSKSSKKVTAQPKSSSQFSASEYAAIEKGYYDDEDDDEGWWDSKGRYHYYDQK